MNFALAVFFALLFQESAPSSATDWSFFIGSPASQRQTHRHRALTDKQKERMHSVAQQAREIVSTLPSEEQKNQLSGSLAAIFAVSGDLPAAREIANSIRSDNARMEALSAIADAQAGNGDFAGALETAATIGGETTRSRAIIGVITAQAGAKDFAGALQSAGKVADQPAAYARALMEIADQQANANQKAQALALLGKALESASGVTSCSYETIEDCRTSLLSEIAIAQLRAGNAKAAQETLDLAQQGLSQASQEERFVSAAEIAAAEQEMGHSERAKELLSSMRGAVGEFAETMSAMQQASEAATKGDIASLRSAVDSISNPEQRGMAQLMMAQAYAQTGDAKSALDTLRVLKPLSQRAQFAGNVAQSLADKGKFTDAEEALKIGMSAAETEENDRAITELLNAGVQVYASAGDAEGARGKAELIKDRESRAAAARSAAKTLASKKKDAEMLKWSATETSVLVKVNILLGVAEGIASQDAQTSAKE
jgi:hypothetical protein